MKKRKDGRYLKVITVNGKRLYFYSTEDTEKKAEKDINRQILEYTQKEEKGKLFSEVADEWEENHCSKLEYNTSRRYKTLLKHAKEDFEGKYIKEIQPIDIERHVEYFAMKNYATKTIKDQLSVVRLVFKYAYVKGYILTDPTRYTTPPKGKASTPREALTDDEIEVVKNSINCTFGLCAYFLMYTGLRKGEALALQYKDIDFENKEIHVTKSVYHDGNKPYIKSTKTQSGIRTVILPDLLADKLSQGKPEDYIFSDGPTPLSNSAFQCRWAKYCEETGLSITAHQLRHTYATILFEADIDAKDAQQLMGHSDIAVTRNIYTHIRSKRLQDTATKLNTFIS